MSAFIRLAEVDPAPSEGRVVAIGVFDGVHLGHQGIVREAVAAATGSGARATAVTFYPHPETVLRPGSLLRSLTLPQRKTELLQGLGVREVVTVEFDLDFARLSPEEFCRVVLSASLGATLVLVGENFRFGRHGLGTPDDLALFGAAHGFGVRSVSLVQDGGEPISSTRIRSLLGRGEVGQAAELLGRPHRLEGAVVSGAGRGRTLGFPTANLAVSGDLALPGAGVYVTQTTIDGVATYGSVTSVGTNPTFETSGLLSVETLLLDYEGGLYGCSLAVDFLVKVREQRSFADKEALIEQIRTDVLAAREWHGLHAGLA